MSQMEIEKSGNKYWRDLNGYFHREDGPAIEYVDGTKECYINGKEYTFEDWLSQFQFSNEEKVLLCLKWK